MPGVLRMYMMLDAGRMRCLANSVLDPAAVLCLLSYGDLLNVRASWFVMDTLRRRALESFGLWLFAFRAGPTYVPAASFMPLDLGLYLMTGGTHLWMAAHRWKRVRCWETLLLWTLSSWLQLLHPLCRAAACHTCPRLLQMPPHFFFFASVHRALSLFGVELQSSLRFA